MSHTQYKCQVQGKESIIDNMFVIFSQSYLMNAVTKRVNELQCNNTNNKLALLELGCYNGRVHHFLIQQMIVTSYTGVDVRKDYLDHSIVASRKDATLLCEDVTQGLSVPDESQDMIISSEVLEHINADKLPGVIATLFSKIKPGGRMVIGFPMNTRQTEFHKLENETTLGHVNFIVHEDFIELCESLGFKYVNHDSSYTIRSSYRLPNTVRKDPAYIKLKDRLGSQVARAIFLTLSDDHTGGCLYTFDKPDPTLNVVEEV
jgi:SAM-dependent methyltransferase